MPDYRTSAPCYYDLSGGMRVPDKAFTALLGHPLPPREMQKGDLFTPNSTLTEAKRTLLGRMLVSVAKSAADRMAEGELVEVADSLIFESPIRMLTISGGGFGPKRVQGLADLLNGKVLKGVLKML